MEILLMTAGFIIIAFALYSIKKYRLELKNLSNDVYKIHSDTKEYYFMIQDLITKMEELVDYEMKNIETKQNFKSKKEDGLYEKISQAEMKLDSNIVEEKSDIKSEKASTNKKNANTDEKMVLKLYRDGNSIQQIAKKLGRGIREIEVMLKFARGKF